MGSVSRGSGALLMLAMLAMPAAGSLAAQEQDQTAQEPTASSGDVMATVTAEIPDESQMTKGPKVEGIISARSGNRIQVTTADGARTVVYVTETTKVKGSGGFLGLGNSKLASNALLNGLPITAETLQWDGGLVAKQVVLKTKDLRTANMIHNGTDQRFAEQTAATDALRSRVGDIDQYNVKATTNVNFDTGKAVLSEQAKADLCAAASQADGMDNALLLVIGYTDSTGSQELNQTLSEKRASRVVNHLQQACGWKPYRMLTPTGMAEADPAADNSTPEGKAQNRRVAVNILVSKAVDGI